jgi:hypothetical protein
MPAKHGGKASKNAITLAAPQLFPDHHLLVGVDAVYLKDVLGKIQTDRANLHVDGPLMCFVIDHPMALRCRERVPSTTSEAGDFAREPANACGQTCLLEVAEENSGGKRWLAQSESMPYLAGIRCCGRYWHRSQNPFPFPDASLQVPLSPKSWLTAYAALRARATYPLSTCMIILLRDCYLHAKPVDLFCIGRCAICRQRSRSL